MRFALLFLILLADCAECALAPLWRLGFDDYSVSDFGIESYVPNAAPGSPAVRDDDYYFAGNYAVPIGAVPADEPVENFERLVASYDPTKRIHFPLTGEHQIRGWEFQALRKDAGQWLAG